MTESVEEAAKGATTIIEVDQNWWKIWRNRRYVLSVMACFGMMNMYATRVNLAVAIVAMTEPKNITNSEGITEIQDPDFKWSSTQRGNLLAAFYYGYVTMQLPAGMILKKISGHIAFGVGTFVPGLITLVTPLLATHSSFEVLLISRIIMGMFQAAAVPSILSFWITWAPPLERARLHGIAISGAFIGTVITMPLAGWVGQVFGWESIFYVFGVIVCVWYVVWLILIRATPDTDPFISEREKGYIKRAIGERKEEDKSPPVPWLKILLSAPVWAVFIAGFSWGWGYVTMLNQLPSYLKASVGFDLAKNGALSALPYLTMYLMSLLAGYLADILLVKKLLTVTQVRKYFITIALTLQMLFILVAAYLETKPVLNIFFISLGIGFGAFTYSGVGINYVDLAPKFSPIIGGIGNTFATVCGILSPLITGFIVTSDSGTEEVKQEWRIVFYIAAGVYAIGAVVYWFLGSAKEQEWAKVKSIEEKASDRHNIIVAYDNPVFNDTINISKDRD